MAATRSKDLKAKETRITCLRGSEIDPLTLETLLGEDGYRLSWADPEALSTVLAASRPPELLLAAYNRKDPAIEEALAVARAARDSNLFVPILLLCPRGRSTLRVRALQLGADECMNLDDPPTEMLARIEALLRIKSIQDRMARSRRDLQRRVSTDRVTGLLNRVAFEARSAQELERGRRHQEPLSLLQIELDGFSEHQRLIGEEGTEALLKLAADRVTESLREIDVVGRLSLCCFGLILPATHVAGAITVGERIWESIRQTPIQTHRGPIRVCCSLGVAFYPARNIKGAEDLRTHAQRALRRAQEEGGDRICLFQTAHYLYQSSPSSGQGASLVRGEDLDTAHERP